VSELFDGVQVADLAAETTAVFDKCHLVAVHPGIQGCGIYADVGEGTAQIHLGHKTPPEHLDQLRLSGGEGAVVGFGEDNIPAGDHGFFDLGSQLGAGSALSNACLLVAAWGDGQERLAVSLWGLVAGSRWRPASTAGCPTNGKIGHDNFVVVVGVEGAVSFKLGANPDNVASTGAAKGLDEFQGARDEPLWLGHGKRAIGTDEVALEIKHHEGLPGGNGRQRRSADGKHGRHGCLVGAQ